MAKNESDIAHRIQLHLSQYSVRMHKNVRGLFWTLDQRAKIKAGLQVPGASDLIGWTPVVVTQEMVGRTVAVYTAIEVKTATGGNGTPEQQHFLQVVRQSGGFAGIARSDEDAKKIVEK